MDNISGSILKDKTMLKNLIGETLFVLFGGSMILSPSSFLKLLAKVARLDYENTKRNFAELKKRDPNTLSFNERLALQNEKIYSQAIGNKKDIYGPETMTQKWLMRILGVLLVVSAVVLFFHDHYLGVVEGH